MNHAPSFRAGKARIAVIPFAPAHRGGRSHCGASALRAHEPMPDEVLLDHLATPPSSRLLVDQVEANALVRSEEHTSELQSLMRISYAVFCLKKKKQIKKKTR